ncbi:hypothetical protein [Thermostichus vulcanus]|uniref:Uncharacterized protein n=1 Tax=Thermostichus vulcanus str. 'Rupite' TaxID=2813851 RepID=A0ABT0CFY7_THEVL|nr:hypothetical protein [Thermostichus vulcanus]MCJ2544300.1 hypothetical protein [Thermostichus vulcanus str. 'Rupite']
MTLAEEIQISKGALEAAVTCASAKVNDPTWSFTIPEVTVQIQCAEDYFYSELRLPSDTLMNPFPNRLGRSNLDDDENEVEATYEE